MEEFEIFAAAPPGLEPMLLPEFRALGYKDARYGPGGVTMVGTWADVWRLNLELRGASRVLARIGTFRASHLNVLAQRAAEFDWNAVLPRGVAVRVEVTCARSKIYHEGAAKERIGKAMAGAGLRMESEAELRLLVRIERNVVTLSLDTSGALLHKRGHKEAVGKAPIRETMAALFLRAMGFDGTQRVMDPMCGSGTFLIEAAEIACGAQAGRSRDFAFQHFVGFDAEAFAEMRRSLGPVTGPPLAFGSDRDAGAIRSASANAARAGVEELCAFSHHAVSDASPPDGPPGIVIVNPPYGGRVGQKKQLFALYGALGKTLTARFGGWKVGIITSEPSLAKATGLKLMQGPKVPHGGLNIWLFQSQL
ncbi:putative N6-adenine-specific DNA methylase [Litoreibacter ponti]|uniref:Putative N6-adenine-specific DNA methylase n=1 Tax=Litoreibacter ponti TaxID=1510457 RepID=A0A2T6BHP2_9RHOB|nr:RNA methyltransferase [Litoreibacter ponti]PTX55572.1 putative N6-adenine-specific DNA methylase [Litoreibacter ponti]